jgi:hypothetical protein
MRERFGEYYRPSSSEFDRLWEEALLVFDTNVLLNLYRISLGSRRALLAILEQYRDRVWIPYQVGLEYHRNRLKVIDDQNAVYSKLAAAVDKATNEIKKATSEWPKERHPRFDVSEFVDLTEKSLQPIKDYIEASRPTEPRDIDSALRDDPILDALTDIFSTAVGENYSSQDLERHRIEARRRFEEEIPPGYRDTSKGREQVFGDFLVWRQTLDHAKALDRSVILVTDERKEDWWRIIQNRVVGPRVELLQEFEQEVGRPFYMYSSDQFIRYASGYLKAPVNEGLVLELQDLSKSVLQHRADYSEDSDLLRQWRAITKAKVSKWTAQAVM